MSLQIKLQLLLVLCHVMYFNISNKTCVLNLYVCISIYYVSKIKQNMAVLGIKVHLRFPGQIPDKSVACFGFRKTVLSGM